VIERRWCALALALALTSCASPEARYYVLAAVPGTEVKGRAITVELRRVGLAGYLDRPDIITRNSSVRLQFASNERWAEPLGDMITRVLAEDLVQRLSGSSIFTETGSISTVSDNTVEVDVQRFDLDQTSTVTLLAQVAVRRQGVDKLAASRAIRLTAQPESNTTSEMAKTMSSLLGRLADAIAVMLRKTEGGGSVAPTNLRK
jgi:uncharacterized protein